MYGRRGRGGGDDVCWQLCFCLNPRREPLEFGLNRVAWPESLCSPVDVPGVEAESEQSLPGEDVPSPH